MNVSEHLAEHLFVDASNVAVKRRAVPGWLGFRASTYDCRSENASMG
jgi:hypothetical protein